MKAPSPSRRDERSSYSDFFRAFNDDLVALSARGHAGALQIVCECSRDDCTTTLQIHPDEYRVVRADDTRFLMSPGHEREETERVVMRYGEISLVERREPPVEPQPFVARATGKRWRPLALVVDEEPAICELCATCLQDAGFVVLVASDGRQGLDEARSLRPDLIVTDAAMPVLGDFRLIQALDTDERTRDIPIIVLSGETDRARIVTGLRAGALACVSKPFDPAVFTSVVMQLA